ncbi:MAG: SagB family peptide dehydrogenase, partial [Rhodothermales bacterium]|nr:SagB family peptide dehydrogenase [Rhodothermales bacterium]
RVVEARRSVRRYDRERPVTLRQLGEFLYRVGRLADFQQLRAPAPGGPVSLMLAARPYPSGGGLYELELYPVLHRCDGAEPGLYRYDPERHALEPYAGLTDDVLRLLRSADWTGRRDADNVQVLLVVASRFGRLAWKYEGLAYALTLKHVGVLYQSMYLAATAMGLAPCALGTGDGDLFARAAGVDYYAEPAVGEFLLGSRPHDGG